MAKYATRAPLAAEQNALMSYNVVAQPPASVYYLGAYLPWGVFQQNFSGKENLAWIETEGGWDAIAKTPKGTWVREFIFVPLNGNLIFNKIAPGENISTEKFDPVISGYKYVWLYAENPGAYISSFQNGGLKSNNVTLYVS